MCTLSESAAPSGPAQALAMVSAGLGYLAACDASGAGRLAGDLTPAGAAALTVVLDAPSGKAGPEDTRTLPQRRHDALEEACQRLIRS